MASGPPSPSVGRRLRLLEVLLGPLLVLLLSGLEPVLGQKVYTNTWAVHIPGGQEEANAIASKYGFINHGHVSCRLVFFAKFASSQQHLNSANVGLFGLLRGCIKGGEPVAVIYSMPLLCV